MIKEKRSARPNSEQPSNVDALSPLLQDKGALRAEYRKRQTPFTFLKKIHPADEQKYTEEGWQVHHRGKTLLRLKRPKSHNDELEDRAWCLFYRMGYPEL